MLNDGEEEDNFRFYFTKKSEDEIKQEILDEEFKRVDLKRKKDKIPAKPNKKKRPFLKIGFVVLIVGVLGILIGQSAPWMFISYNPSGNEELFEESYYQNFESKNASINNTVEAFFEKNSSRYLGLNINDFYNTPKITTYLFYILIGLGIIFSIFSILDKKILFPIEDLITIQTIYTIVLIPILIYIVFILVKFLGSNILMATNCTYLRAIFPNLYILYPAPIILLFLSAGLMKICFTIAKSNFKEIENLNQDFSKFKTSFKLKGGRAK